jgi:hypothetical protein
MPQVLRMRRQAESDADGIVIAGDGTEHALSGCAVLGCRRVVVIINSGFQVPFCREHWGKLKRSIRIRLCQVAPASPFDIEAVARAARVVRDALRELGGRT